MTPTLVGSLGPTASAGNNTAVTPSWDSGASRAVGDFLACFVTGSGGTTTPATPSGWNAGPSFDANALFYKYATGGDAAPTIAAASGVAWYVTLAEFVNVELIAPEQSAGGGYLGSALACSAADAASGNLILYGGMVNYGSNQTATLTSTLNNATISANNTNNGTNGTHFYDHGFGITTAHASADSLTTATSPGSPSNVRGWIASFKPAVVLSRTPSDGYTMSDSIARTGVHPRSISDGYTMGDGISEVNARARGLSDGYTIGSTVVAGHSYTSSIADGYTMGDSVPRTVHYAKSINDAYSYSDAISDVTHREFGLSVQCYQVVGSPEGATTSFAGWPQNQQGTFDIVGAAALSVAAGNGGVFCVCDNAIKQALDECPYVTRVL